MPSNCCIQCLQLWGSLQEKKTKIANYGNQSTIRRRQIKNVGKNLLTLVIDVFLLKPFRTASSPKDHAFFTNLAQFLSQQMLHFFFFLTLRKKVLSLIISLLIFRAVFVSTNVTFFFLSNFTKKSVELNYFAVNISRSFCLNK